MLKKFVIIGTAAAVFAGPAMAAPVATSSASDLAIDLAVANTLGVSVGPLSSASGSAPGDYANSDTALAANVDANISTGFLTSTDLGLQTQLSTAAASGTASVPSAMGSALINGLSFSFTNSLLGIELPSLLSFSAGTISSESNASAAGGVLTASGNSIIENAELGGLLLAGLNIDLGLFAAADANTVLLDSELLGIEIILNEQNMLGDGVTTAGIETNALRISLSDFLLNGNLLSGDILVGRSRAFVEAGEQIADVPAPGALGLLGLGLLGLAGWRRRARA